MFKALAFLFAVACLGVSLLSLYGVVRYTEAGPLPETRLVVVPKGSGLKGIASQLLAEQVISDKWIFMGAAALSKKHTSIKAGEYEFAANVPMQKVLDELVKGSTFKRSITAREGLTSYQIVEMIKKADKLEGDIGAVPPEGTLLPETYYYSGGDSRVDIITRMQAGMTDTLNELWPLRDQTVPLKTIQEAVVLASIVEKETGVPEERKRVAGVFINRLKQGMKLQTDPTVIYALTMGKHEDEGQGPLGRRLLRKDLENTDSPYNTYMYEGLPPGPIANPGRASIEAVLHPEMHDYLFFVADGKGGHIFARTAREHEQNVVNWRRIRAANN